MARVAVAYVEVRPDLSGFGELLRAELEKVRVKHKVEINPDLSGFSTQLRSKLAALKLSHKLGVAADGSSVDKAVKDLADKATKGADQAGKKAGKAFGSSFAKQWGLGINLKLGQWGPILGAIAATAAPLAQMLSSLGGGMVALASTAAQAGGALGAGLLTNVLALGQAAGTTLFALQGFTTVLKNLNNMQQQAAAGVAITKYEYNNYKKALNTLAPAAQQVVGALSRLNGQIATVRKGVAQRLFTGLAADLRQMGNQLLPLIGAQLQNTASILNRTARGFFAWTRQTSTLAKIRDVLGGNNQIIAKFTSALIPLADAALTLVKAFQPLGVMLANYIGLWSKGIDKNLNAAAASGKLANFVGQLGDMFKAVMPIIGDVGKAVWNTLNAASGPGKSMLALLRNLTDRWVTWTSSIAGRTTIANWVQSSLPILRAMGRLLADIGRALSDLAKSGDAANFVDQVRQIIPPLKDLLAQLSASNAAGALASGLANIGHVLAEIDAGGALAHMVELIGSFLDTIVKAADAFPPLKALLGGLISGLTTLAALRFTATITGLLYLPKAVGFLVTATGQTERFTAALQKLGLVAAAGGTGGLAGFVARLGSSLLGLANGLYLAAVQMANAGGAANAMAVGVRAAIVAIATNPLAAIAVGIAAIGTAIYFIASNASQASPQVQQLDKDLRSLGATNVADQLKALNDELGKQNSAWSQFVRGLNITGWWKDLDKPVKDFAKHVKEVNGQVTTLKDQYGTNLGNMVDAVQGFAAGTGDGFDVVIGKMSQLAGQQHTSELTTQQMVRTMAIWYDKLDVIIGDSAASSGTYFDQIAAGYDTISQAAADAFTKQAMVAQKTHPGSASLYGGIDPRVIAVVQTAAKKHVTPKLPTYKPPKDAYSGIVTAAEDATKKAGKYLSSWKPALPKLDVLTLIKGGQAYDTGYEIARYMAMGMTSGAKNIAKATAYIEKYFKTNLSGILTGLKKFASDAVTYSAALPATWKADLKKMTSVTQLQAYLAKQGQYWQDMLSKVVDFKGKVKDALSGGADLVNYFGFIPTAAEVQQQLDDRLARIRSFAQGIADLQSRGLSKDLAASWLQAGYDTAGNLVEGLKDATPEELAQISSTFAQIGTTTETIADDAAKNYYGFGQSTIQGYINGINSMQSTLNNAISKAFTDAFKAAQKAMKSKSPSQVYAGLGTDTMAGYIQGIAGMQTKTLGAVTGLFDQVGRVSPATLATPSVRPGYASAGALSRADQATYVKVFLGDREITDILKVESRKLDEQRARALMSGRRGG